MISDIGIGLEVLGQGTATGVKGHTSDSVLGDIVLGIELLSNGEI